MSEPVHIISLGAGVQSSTMALMAAAGEITPMPKCAIFADTGDEPQAVYDWLGKLAAILPLQIEIAYRRNGLPIKGCMERHKLSDFIVEGGFSQIPCFTRSVNGKAAFGKRQCTRHWKINPVHQKIRELLGAVRKRMESGSVVLWQGISMDEISRMKPSRDAWLTHRFPLIEERMTRGDCVRWLTKHGYPVPPKSACVYCPYKDRARWAADKARGGQEWETVRRVDAVLAGRGEYLTADLKRIDDIDFTKPLPKHDDPRQVLLFNNECEGMCGV